MDLAVALVRGKDERPPRGAWAPGNYVNECLECKLQFIGDKRACVCAKCSYNDD